MTTAKGRTDWFLRIAFVPPVLIACLILQFETGVAQGLEATRMDIGLLPFPCLLFKQSLKLWYVVPVVAAVLVLASARVSFLVDAKAIAIGYALLSVLLCVQLAGAGLLLAAFIR